MALQAAGDSVSFGGVSGGKIIGAGGGAGSIIGETVEVNGPVIHIHNLTADGARILRGMMGVSPEVPSGGAPAPSSEASALARTGIDEMLRLMKSYAARGLKALQVEAGQVQFSAVDLLLRKAVLLVAEANQLTVAANTPEKADLTRRMDQGALGEMLAGFDSGAAQARLRKALEVLREAHELAPDSTAVMLQMAQVLGRLGGDEAEERDLLDEVLRRVGTPWTEEQRLHRAQAMYLLGTLGRNRDEDLLREAREQFARLGRVDWMRQCDQAVAAAAALPRRQRRKVRAHESPLRALPRRLLYTAGILAALWTGGYVVLIVIGLAFQDWQVDPEVYPAGVVQQAFTPAGRWLVEDLDNPAVVLDLGLLDGGTIYGKVVAVDGREAVLAGTWGYDAARQVVSMGLTIQGQQMPPAVMQVTEAFADGFLVREDDGTVLRFTRQ